MEAGLVAGTAVVSRRASRPAGGCPLLLGWTCSVFCRRKQEALGVRKPAEARLLSPSYFYGWPLGGENRLKCVIVGRLS